MRSGKSRTAFASCAAFVAGATLSTQSFTNGQLAESIGSSGAAAFISTLVGLIFLLSLSARRGTLRRALRLFRQNPDMRSWYWMGGVLGGSLIIVSTYAAPIVGIAILTVAIVSGQAVGGLVTDALGLSPMGKAPPDSLRVIGVVVAIGAVAISAGSPDGKHPLALLALLVAAGAGFAVQQAAVGHLRVVLDDPYAAGACLFAVSGVLSLTLTLAAGPPSAKAFEHTQWHEYLGGALGVVVVVTMATMVSVIGVLRLTIAMIAGQTVAGVVIDLVSPANRAELSAATYVGVALTLVAAGLTTASQSRKHVDLDQPVLAADD